MCGACGNPGAERGGGSGEHGGELSLLCVM